MILRNNVTIVIDNDTIVVSIEISYSLLLNTYLCLDDYVDASNVYTSITKWQVLFE